MVTTSRDHTVPVSPAGVDEIPPPGRMGLLALQHVLVMYSGAIAVPFIIGSALELSLEQIAYLIQADLITCGIATLIQTVGFWRFGIRMPLMQGLTFASISPVIAIASNPALLAGGEHAGLRAVYGAVIASGLFAILIAPLGRYIVRLFPPAVVGSVLLVIGLSLISVAIQYASGGFVEDAGAPHYIALAFVVLGVIIAINVFGRGFLRNVAVFIGLAVGVIVAGLVGMLDFSAMRSSVPSAASETGAASRPDTIGWRATSSSQSPSPSIVSYWIGVPTLVQNIAVADAKYDHMPD